jgi:SAM-dependent methyltransferase
MGGQMETRATREKEQYNEGLDRDDYVSFFSHCSAYSKEETDSKIYELLKDANRKTVLEIGSTSWYDWIEKNNIVPREVHSINISEKELDKGRELANSATNKPFFHLMDAHQMKFDMKFDYIIGGGILHHLDLEIVLPLMKECLNNDGKLLFIEPLDINFISKIVRFFTPKARTIDEKPFRFKEIRMLRKYFKIDIFSYQFLSVPFGVISKILFKDEKNKLTWLANAADNKLKIYFPFMKYYYRYMIIEGKK